MADRTAQDSSGTSVTNMVCMKLRQNDGREPRGIMSTRLRFALTTAALLTLPAGLAYRSVAQQHMETSTFNSAPARPKENPQVVARGKAAYEKSCQSCHSADMRGTDTGPSILRSQISLTDHGGDMLVPAMLGKDPDVPNHAINIRADAANAVAAYVRTLVAQIGSQGRAPGDAARSPDILVGDATRGKQYFAAKCASCHSVDGDLKGFAKKVPSPKMLQTAWIRGSHLGVTPPAVTVTVTEQGKPQQQGTLIHIDDFIVTLQKADGSMLSVRRNGPAPTVVVHDPLEAHRNLLPVYSDKDIHDVTAYLVTLK